jgi:hypothetical protein
LPVDGSIPSPLPQPLKALPTIPKALPTIPKLEETSSSSASEEEKAGSCKRPILLNSAEQEELFRNTMEEAKKKMEKIQQIRLKMHPIIDLIHAQGLSFEDVISYLHSKTTVIKHEINKHET